MYHRLIGIQRVNSSETFNLNLERTLKSREMFSLSYYAHYMNYVILVTIGTLLTISDHIKKYLNLSATIN